MSDANTNRGNSPAELSEWLREMPEQERQEIEQTWELAEMGREPEPTPAESKEAWGLLSVAMESDPVEHAAARRPQRTFLRLVPRRFAYAVAMVLLLVWVGTWWWTGSVTLGGLPGDSSAFLLPDGSSVELAAGSSLSYRRGFRGNTRSTQLSGEAFFEVTPHQNPFTVQTFNAVISVSGTRFNVRAWEHDSSAETAVTLEEGSVRFAPLESPDRTVRLESGQSSRLAAGGDTPEPPTDVSLDRALAWREGGFNFDDMPLQSIVEEIERRYRISILLPPQMHSRKLVLFHDRPESAETLMEAISAVSGFRFRLTGDGFEFLTESN